MGAVGNKDQKLRADEKKDENAATTSDLEDSEEGEAEEAQDGVIDLSARKTVALRAPDAREGLSSKDLEQVLLTENISELELSQARGLRLHRRDVRDLGVFAPFSLHALRSLSLAHNSLGQYFAATPATSAGVRQARFASRCCLGRRRSATYRCGGTY